jgi:hypothetical protein
LNGEAAAFADLQTKFDLTSALDSVHSAVQQVKEDRADIAGTSQKAKDADRSEADAKHSLADATRGVGDAQQRLADSYLKVGDAQEKVGDANLKLADAQHSLAEAQAELNLFNSPRGQQERAFERDIIVRRVVTTPEGEEQKQLDLLRNQDDTAKKQQDLADRVHSAQEGVASATRGVRDALRGVADAQRAVITAEHGVEDATFRVRDAQDRVSQATEARKKVSEDASQRIAGDIDKEQKALLNVVTVLENAAAKGEVGNDTVRHWIGLLKQAADAMNGPVSQAVDSLALKTHNLGAQGGVGQVALPPNIPISAADRGRLTYESQPGFQGPISAQDRATLHSLGIPGFATGGEVPGALGAPMLALVHGGERVLTPAQQRSLPKPPPSGQSIVVHQENNFHGDVPSTADLEYANRALGWRLSQTGRNG